MTMSLAGEEPAQDPGQGPGGPGKSHDQCFRGLCSHYLCLPIPCTTWVVHKPSPRNLLGLTYLHLLFSYPVAMPVRIFAKPPGTLDLVQSVFLQRKVEPENAWSMRAMF
jgi:hypothetical protein